MVGCLFGWLVGLGLTALSDSISVYIGPTPREREKEDRNDRREKKCPNNPTRTYCKRNRPLPYYKSKSVGRPGTGSLPSTIAPPDHPRRKTMSHNFVLPLINGGKLVYLTLN